MESFVSNVRISLIFYMSVAFMEWSEEPVATVELVSQHNEFMLSLWICYDVILGTCFLVVFLFFFFSVFTSLYIYSVKKLSGTFHTLILPCWPALQKCPSSIGLKSMPKILPSWALTDITYGTVSIENLDIDNY